MKVEEGAANGCIGPVKTESSKEELPLDPEFATILLQWKLKSNRWERVFPIPITVRSYHASPIKQERTRIRSRAQTGARPVPPLGWLLGWSIVQAKKASVGKSL